MRQPTEPDRRPISRPCSDLPVILVVDCARMAHSVAALVRGYASHRDDVHVSGVILNKVGSDRHEKMLRDALEAIRMPVLGVLRQDEAPETARAPSRPRAGRRAWRAGRFHRTGGRCTSNEGCDLDAILSAARIRAHRIARTTDVLPLKPLGQQIAIARDIAFAFCYEHLLSGWRKRRCRILRSFRRSLTRRRPTTPMRSICRAAIPSFTPGRLAECRAVQIRHGTARRPRRRIFGECGGYMVLGEGLVAADGARHDMLGLLPLSTSFAERKRHLGYRRVGRSTPRFFDGPMMAHEFHYATIVSEGDADRLFDTQRCDRHAALGRPACGAARWPDPSCTSSIWPARP